VGAAAGACALMALVASIVPARRAFAVEPARVLKGE
jgi:ABC-type lipoprotein release transport system permease subunit